ncbi:MAG: ABC transporter ATP-binding protein, partial [Gemmatimonadota bacterium]|nr:ABC transporter ATP-binding protein [Gemmatimonadota bacterium]
ERAPPAPRPARDAPTAHLVTRREPPLLSGSGLRKTYGDRVVVDVERIDIFPGELVSVFGPNGAGKSTLLRLLAMLEEPTAGRVEFRGSTGRPAERAMRASSAVVFQRPHFWRESVAYNVGLGLKLRGVPRVEARDRIRRICEQLGIGELLNADIADLSGGEAQRVSVARALVLDPEILFLDEPTTNLDTDSRSELREDLERVARERAASIFLITHDRNEAFHLADRVGVLREGRLVQVGTPTDIYENPVDVYTARMTGAEFTLHGTVTASGERMLTIDVGGPSLLALGDASVGDRVKIAYRPEDLVLGPPDAPTGDLSTRNLLFATVTDRRDMGGLVRLRMEGPPELVALVTRDAAEELGVRAGTRVAVRAKATALHAFATAVAASDTGGPPTASGADGQPPAASDTTGEAGAATGT